MVCRRCKRAFYFTPASLEHNEQHTFLDVLDERDPGVEVHPNVGCFWLMYNLFKQEGRMCCVCERKSRDAWNIPPLYKRV
jgi:hypothetical protein